MGEAAHVRDCVRDGYAPRGYGLADFSIVRQGEFFHLFHIPRVPGNDCTHPCNEHWLGHAVSRDLDTWTTLDPVLSAEPKNYFESAHIWAPFVLKQPEKTWMFYTGLSAEPSQVLCAAFSSDPELKVWERIEENPIIPLEGFDWHWRNEKGHVRQARDPHVVAVGNHFLMAYTTMHANGCPAVGGLVSEDLRHWEDIGPVLYRPFGPVTWMPESVQIQQLKDGRWVLIPSAGGGMEYYLSENPYSWQGISPTRINYVNGEGAEPLGLELISRDGDKGWVVTFFELVRNRMFCGFLSMGKHPWTLQRYTDPREIPPL
jgi:sucrose-6-phosphate hydrolase SacC (GH32 family)